MKARRRRPQPRSSTRLGVDTFPLFCVASGLPKPECEVVFAPPRKYRADYCWPVQKVIVECNGAIWVKGGHSSGTGLLRDYAKSNLAQLLGFRLFTFTPDQLASGEAVAFLKQVLC